MKVAGKQLGKTMCRTILGQLRVKKAMGFEKAAE